MRLRKVTKMSTLLMLILSAILLVSFAEKGFAQSDSHGKIGYVDLSTAFDEYQKTKDFDKELERKGDMRQKQREKLVKEIRAMRDELELLNENARKQKEQEIEQNILDLQEFDRETKSELTKERDDMVRDILNEMSDVIQEYGKTHGYSIILNERVLLYGNNTMDLTGTIIKILNEGIDR